MKREWKMHVGLVVFIYIFIKILVSKGKDRYEKFGSILKLVVYTCTFLGAYTVSIAIEYRVFFCM